MKYTIDELIQTFTKHSEIQKIWRLGMINKFKEDFPDMELPENLKDDFEITEALKIMCEEIKSLKGKE